MKFIVLISLLFSSFSFAEILEVHSVVKKTDTDGEWIIKITDGRVGFWNEADAPEIKPQTLTHAVIDGDLSPYSVLSRVRILGYMDEAPVVSGNKSRFELNYTPTVYPTYGMATDVLNGMRRNWVNGSQCYDRSHVWAFEEATYSQRYLQKAFLFFADSYIQRYNFPWWFHTAPYALVKLNGEIVERIMDPAFTQYPLKFKLWTDKFMRNQAECKVVTKYTDYSEHPGEDDCYVIKKSIFFWQPKDLEAFDRSGVEKKKFIDWEVNHAYTNAFGINR